jgi:hypothetical protein
MNPGNATPVDAAIHPAMHKGHLGSMIASAPGIRLPAA